MRSHTFFVSTASLVGILWWCAERSKILQEMHQWLPLHRVSKTNLEMHLWNFEPLKKHFKTVALLNISFGIGHYRHHTAFSNYCVIIQCICIKSWRHSCFFYGSTQRHQAGTLFRIKKSLKPLVLLPILGKNKSHRQRGLLKRFRSHARFSTTQQLFSSSIWPEKIRLLYFETQIFKLKHNFSQKNGGGGMLKAPKWQEKCWNSASSFLLAVGWRSKWYSVRSLRFYMQQKKLCWDVNICYFQMRLCISLKPKDQTP